MKAEDRAIKPLSREPAPKGGDETGPGRPDIRKPDGGNELLKRLKRVDPDQAKKYRQRSGQ